VDSGRRPTQGDVGDRRRSRQPAADAARRRRVRHRPRPGARVRRPPAQSGRSGTHPPLQRRDSRLPRPGRTRRLPQTGGHRRRVISEREVTPTPPVFAARFRSPGGTRTGPARRAPSGTGGAPRRPLLCGGRVRLA